MRGLGAGTTAAGFAFAVCIGGLTACGEGTLSSDDEPDLGEAGDALRGGAPWADAAGPPLDALRPPTRRDAAEPPGEDTDATVTEPTPPSPDAAAPAPAPDAAPPPPTPECVRIRVADTGGIGLNVRPDPSTNGAPLGNLPDGSVVDVVAVVQGQDIDGNTTWYEIQRGDLRGFVAGTWAICMGSAVPGETDDVFLLPFGCGQTLTVTQGNNSEFSHNGRSAWSYDFSMGIGTPMLAMRPGAVTHADGDTVPGDPCYDGGGPDCINAANYVVVQHDDGSQTLYAHLSVVRVSVGEGVSQGQPVGDSGSTGWSTGPHAHVERMEACGSAFCQSIPMPFADVEGDGMPVSGQAVTSRNGCGP